MSTNNIKFDIIETEHHKLPNDKLWKYKKLREIITQDLKEWSKSNRNDRTLIFTKDDETTRYIVCEFYAHLKVVSTTFVLSAHKDTTESDDEENEKTMQDFKIGNNLVAVSTLDVHEHVQFNFVKNVIFFDFPDFAIFSQTANFFGNKAKDCSSNGKITVFQSGMDEKQLVYFIEMLQSAGQTIPKFLVKFVINDNQKLSDNATISMPVAATSSLLNGNAPVTLAPAQPSSQPQSIPATAIVTTKSSKTTANNKNCSQYSVMMDGKQRQIISYSDSEDDDDELTMEAEENEADYAYAWDQAGYSNLTEEDLDEDM